MQVGAVVEGSHSTAVVTENAAKARAENMSLVLTMANWFGVVTVRWNNVALEVINILTDDSFEQ